MTHYQLIRYFNAAKNVLILLVVSLLTGLTIACSQGSLATKSVQPSVQSSSHEEEIFTVVETPPSFPGGMARYSDYIRQNLRYPTDAIKNKVEGRVFVSFIIMNDGSLRDVTVLKGLGYGTDNEASRLVQNMPNWKPGKQSGRPVNVKYNLVIHFALADAK